MKEKILCGLDVGSSKVYAVIAEFSQEEKIVKILGIGEAGCEGLKNGVVVNIDNTSCAVSRAIEEAEKEAQVKVKDVIVNVNGHHIEGNLQQGATKVPRSDREITQEDVERVISSARAVPLASDKQIIHAIPLDFKVDTQKGVDNPVGMEGNHLEVEVLLITGDSAPVNNLNKSITRTGVGIQSITASVLAPASAVITKEEKELGCVLVDVGAQTVNLAVYVEGSLCYIGHIDFGSAYITRDLAHLLRTSFAEAKRIKETYGSAVKENRLDDEVSYQGIDGHTKYTAPIEKINRIIESRVDEMIDFIEDAIIQSGFRQMIPGGIVLSGGGAQLNGMERALSKRMDDLDVRVGKCRGVKGKNESETKAEYSTAIGLIKFAAEEQDVIEIAGGRGFFDKLKILIEELF